MSSDDARNKPERTHLPVLPHSGKVDQLRQEAAMSTRPAEQQGAAAAAGAAPAAPAPARSPEPAAPPAFLGGHTNRINAVPAERKTIEYKLLEGKIIAALKTVYDPEIPVDIYELGLIYDIEIDDDKDVTIRMTLTAPGCPVAGTLPGDVERRVEAIPEVKSATVELVWEPTWSRDMMSETAMLSLGMM
jgi:FeS assembly SUF system protein